MKGRPKGGKRWMKVRGGELSLLEMKNVPIYKISEDLSYDYRNFVVRLTCDSDLRCGKISL